MLFQQKKTLLLVIACTLILAFVCQARAQESTTSPMQDLQTLASEKMQGRAIGTEGNKLAREYIIKRLAGLGLKPCLSDFVQEFNHTTPKGKTLHGKNILACQNGNSKENEMNKYIVVSAHYDHLGTKNNSIYFGADDNASGVAGVLAVATQFQTQRPKHPIVYAFFDGEEVGLIGAEAFLKQAPIPAKQILINVNFDMIARGDKNELFASGSYQNPGLKPLLQELDGTASIKLTFGHDRPEQGKDDWTSQSDHFPFAKAGIPHIYFGVEDHADYHQTSDTVEKVNPKFFNGSIEIVKKAVALIDSKTDNSFAKEAP